MNIGHRSRTMYSTMAGTSSKADWWSNMGRLLKNLLAIYKMYLDLGATLAGHASFASEHT
jgi:hypothetical protein